MCGFFFIHSKKGISVNLAKESGLLIKDRGPEKYIQSINKNIFFCQSILNFTRNDTKKINDKSISSNNHLTLYNGEIYNYLKLKYLSDDLISSDTDLIHHLNIKNVLKKHVNRFEGMFAILALKNDKIDLYTDVNGEKRIFWYKKNGIFIASSEIRPIINYVKSLSLNQNLIRDYLFTRHFMTFNRTVYKEINVLDTGKCISVSLLDHNISKFLVKKSFFDADYSKEINKQPVEIAKVIFKKAANEIVPDKFDYASIASGGIDSSISSFFNYQSIKKPKLYVSLIFPKKDEQGYEFEKYFNSKQTDHVNKIITKDLFTSYLEKSVKRLKQPLPTHSFVSQYILSELVKELGVKCIIGGDGGDEMFGGYELYKKIKYNNYFYTSPSPYTSYVHNDTEYTNKHSVSLSTKKYIDSLWSNNFEEYFSLFKNKTKANIKTILHIDTFLQLKETGLYSSDIMNSAVGIEGRNFYMNENIKKFNFNLSPENLIHVNRKNITTRPFMKKLFKSLFSCNALKKSGFSGYPNESGKKLLNYKDYEYTYDLLNFKPNEKLDRNFEWKLINIELFLRNL